MTDYTSYTDEQLLVLLKNNNEGVFAEIYDRYAPGLFLSVYNKLKDDQQAQEIVHDVFLGIWKNKNASDIKDLRAYLKRAVRLRVINVVLRSKTPAYFELLDSFTQSPFGADHPILKSDLIHLIETWIETFPEKRRKIFVKYYFEELSHLEIAKEMDISSKTVQNQLSISLQYLRSRFGHLLTIFSVIIFS